ncbi:MAG TPA: AAA family ATPase [Micropruina sp.]|mgnify:CR=1 FL=1|nr:AAA family ATPase [Propionibacterium sp.]HMQ37753.1 AAA family ATPase [Micropruina sp.]HMR23306.1 AAA family ATPase [Micropruina sp.]
MLVEREDVLAELLGLAADGFDGHGRLAFLGGEAGVGKTSVVRALAEQVADRCLVRIGVVDNLTTADALAAFVDALPGLEFAEDARKDVRLRSLRDQLRHRPMLLVLEDLHWADQASLDALLFLGRRLEGLPVLIVASYRHDEVSPRHRLTRLLGGLVGLPEVRRIVLPPLSPDGVRILVDRSRATLDVDALHARTGGNPFFVTEVLAGGAETVPDSVRDAVMARFAGVSAAATEVARPPPRWASRSRCACWPPSPDARPQPSTNVCATACWSPPVRRSASGMSWPGRRWNSRCRPRPGGGCTGAPSTN